MHRPVVQKGVMKSEDNSFKMKVLSVFFSYMFKVKKKKKLEGYRKHHKITDDTLRISKDNIQFRQIVPYLDT